MVILFLGSGSHLQLHCIGFTLTTQASDTYSVAGTTPTGNHTTGMRDSAVYSETGTTPSYDHTPGMSGASDTVQASQSTLAKEAVVRSILPLVPVMWIHPGNVRGASHTSVAAIR
jgi:hypothetical protein